MKIEWAIEKLNEMIIKEHKKGKNAKAMYTKEQLMIFCRKMLIEIKNS